MTPAAAFRSQRAPRAQRVCAYAAMILVVAYVIVDVSLQFLPPHYSVVTDAESDLAVGPYGWVMRANFGARGVMSLCIVAAIMLARCPKAAGNPAPSNPAPRNPALQTPTPCSPAPRNTPNNRSLPVILGCTLIAIAGLCSVMLVFFDTDVNAVGQFGMTQHTDTGRTHVVFASIGFIAVMLGMLLLTAAMVFGRVAVAFVFVAATGLLSLAACLLVAPHLIGIAERLCILGILGWAAAVAWRCRDSTPIMPRRTVQF